MSERVALDYTNGLGSAEPIPPEAWTDIDPVEVVELALRHIPEEDRALVHNGMSLLSLVRLAKPAISQSLRDRLVRATGSTKLAIDEFDAEAA